MGSHDIIFSFCLRHCIQQSLLARALRERRRSRLLFMCCMARAFVLGDEKIPKQARINLWLFSAHIHCWNFILFNYYSRWNKRMTTLKQWSNYWLIVISNKHNWASIPLSHKCVLCRISRKSSTQNRQASWSLVSTESKLQTEQSFTSRYSAIPANTSISWCRSAKEDGNSLMPLFHRNGLWILRTSCRELSMKAWQRQFHLLR